MAIPVPRVSHTTHLTTVTSSRKARTQLNQPFTIAPQQTKAHTINNKINPLICYVTARLLRFVRSSRSDRIIRTLSCSETFDFVVLPQNIWAQKASFIQRAKSLAHMYGALKLYYVMFRLCQTNEGSFYCNTFHEHSDFEMFGLLLENQ